MLLDTSEYFHYLVYFPRI